jgi:hypothetical protein
VGCNETINFWIAVIGAATGPIALILQFKGYRDDKACLRVEAAMAYGSCLAFGPHRVHLLNVKLINHGRRIVRIQSVALRINSPWKVKLNWFLFRHQITKKIVQPDISIYTGAVNPISDFPGTFQNVQTYPPKNIYLDESQKMELTLGVDDKIVAMLPEKVAWAIITDHLGRKYKARYNPINFLKTKEEEQQKTTPVKKVEAT